jgi:hypothetical protein
MQADLQEALHCGAMDLEFEPAPSASDDARIEDAGACKDPI